MKQFILLVICCLLYGSFTLNAAEPRNKNQKTDDAAVQKVLDKKQKREMYSAEVEAAMLGLRMGGEYSFRVVAAFGAQTSVNKHGFHYFAGYRFNRHWYVGGVAGIDLTTPFTVSYYDGSNSISRSDKVYVPVVADVRYYFRPARVSTYLYTNLGAEFSKYVGGIYLFGIGFDIRTKGSQCVNLSLGFGSSQYETYYTESIGGGLVLGKRGGLAANLKLGYAF